MKKTSLFFFLLFFISEQFIFAQSEKIKWFDSNSFSIKEINAFGLSPRVLEEKFNEVLPSTLDVFKTYSMELQEPSIEITSIREINTFNYNFSKLECEK